jgi:alanyl-tRNA synthetase/misacylated tRNA(Ala) deacylase
MANLFYDQKYLKEFKTKYVSSFQKDGHNCIVLDESIFYPQGGGQKGDRGRLVIDGTSYNVANTIKNQNSEPGEILLLTDELVPEAPKNGGNVDCFLDWDFRYKQMKLHTCVHLHHCMIESIAGKKVHNPDVSTIEDGFALNRYVIGSIDVSILDEANNKFLEMIKTHAQVITYPDKEKNGFRWWECLEFKIPCGGIHIDYLDEIKSATINVNSKKGYNTIKIAL